MSNERTRLIPLRPAIDDLGPKPRRRRRPGPQMDPREQVLGLVLDHVRTLNAQVEQLGRENQLLMVQREIDHRRIGRLEARILEARAETISPDAPEIAQDRSGEGSVSSDEESSVESPGTP